MGRHQEPVCRLKKALYGLPDSGTYWEQHCDASLRSGGYVPVGEDWPSCYVHPRLKLFLIVYVDDFKLAGPEKNLAEGWAIARKGLVIEDPKPVGLFLGCTLLRDQVVRGGVTITRMTYDMEDFLRACVVKYKTLMAPNAVLRPVATPFTSEDAKLSAAGGLYQDPNDGPTVSCPWCRHTFIDES